MAQIFFNRQSAPVRTKRNALLLPRGQYTVICVDSDVKPTNNGKGQFLKLKFQILSSGPHQYQHFYENIVFEHSHPKAQEIGQAALASFCDALGIVELTNTVQLHNQSVRVEVGIAAASNGFPPKNRIYRYTSNQVIDHESEPMVADRPSSRDAGGRLRQANASGRQQFERAQVYENEHFVDDIPF